ncbi:protein HGH1 homolog [Rhynochetos jubatus]
MAAEAAVAELPALLAPAAGAAARAGAAEAALSLSGSSAGRRLLAERPAVLTALLELAAGPGPPAGPGPGPPAALQALRCLVNVSAEPAAHGPLLAELPALLELLPDGSACGVLANLCRERGSARRVLRGLRERGLGLTPLLRALGDPRPPPELGPLLCNLSQLPEGRRGLLDRSRRSVQRLLPFTQYKASVVHRRGIVGALRNCCFEYEAHEWLLSEEVDILPFLLLPLAGPEEFPEDEMERLPPDLQYLPQDKEREEEPDIRKMLLESLMLLAATKAGRSVLRAKGVYPVLRELHRHEPDPPALAACEKLIQVLIGDEPGPGLENLLEVAIPEEVERELRRLEREEEEARGPTPRSLCPLPGGNTPRAGSPWRPAAGADAPVPLPGGSPPTGNRALRNRPVREPGTGLSGNRALRNRPGQEPGTGLSGNRALRNRPGQEPGTGLSGNRAPRNRAVQEPGPSEPG